MTTAETVRAYFNSLEQKGAWDTFLADEIQFTSFTTPIKRVAGKTAYLEATQRFFSLIQTVDVKGILIEGEKACVFTRYQLQPPGGPSFESHVAELLEVRDGKITSLDIYFDSAPFPK